MKRRVGVVMAGCAALVACGEKDASAPTGEGMHVLSSHASVSRVDTTVAHAPSILLLDAASSARAGVAVSFTVVRGGGAVSDTLVTTDGAGRASIASWKLGPTPTTNSLVIAAQGATPETLTVLGRWPRTLVTGAQSACATKARKIYCWGDNSHLEYGVLSASYPQPVLVPVLPANQFVDELFGGFGHHVCSVADGGFGVCWGRNDFGQSGGLTGTAVRATPLFGHAWRSISVGRITTCAIEMNGDAFCWGANQRGEIGNPAVLRGGARIEAPTKVAAPVTLTQVSAGWQHACGIAEDGTAYCWGANLEGQLGLGSVDSVVSTPTAVMTAEKFGSIAAGGRHTCALTMDGRAFCWGLNQFGQLGDGTTTSRLTPTSVAGDLRFTSIRVGTHFVAPPPPEMVSPPAAGTAGHTCALTETGAAYCWGWNGWGQLGDNTLVDRTAPVPVAGALSFSGLSLGEVSTCGARGAIVWCWGGNSLGQLGDGTTTRRPMPGLAAIP